MTIRNELQSLRTIAKRIARARRIPHHDALDLTARKLEQPHWNALVTAWDNGWRPDPNDVAALASIEKNIDPEVMAIPVLGIGKGVSRHGEIDGHPYELEIDFEVLMGSTSKWCILVDYAPSKKPMIEIYDQSADNPIFNSKFRAKTLAICNDAVEALRARIASDWPRRSTKPDADGNVVHPLSKGISNRWHCLHCDGSFTGSEMAENIWHCPACSAAPIDIFAAPFWKAA